MLASQRGFRILAAVTITISAFLLFQVQPLIGKIILPWFGGSPAVWTTSMLFFQVLLLAGYAYADVVVRFFPPRAQLITHAAVLIGALATLPIMPSERWQPQTGDQPMLHVMLVLAAAVSVPYFALAATAPLVQAWYARALPAGTPYRLYSLSNAGSLAALLSYPIIVERLLTTEMQSYIWSALFALFAICCAILAWRASKAQPASPLEPLSISEQKLATADRPTPRWHVLLWLLLPAIAVVALLALTNHLCRDVAVVPFLWIAPLTLYLLSFIICFDRERWYSPRWWGLATAVSSLLVVCIPLYPYIDSGVTKLAQWLHVEIPFHLSPYYLLQNMVVEGTIYLIWLFCACMLCHGELVRIKPPAKSLTTFYLCVATGGALGGLFVATICPYIFNGYWEFNLVQIAVTVLAAVTIGWNGTRAWFRKYWYTAVPAAICLGSLVFLQSWVLYTLANTTYLYRARNFYGVISVQELSRTNKPEDTVRELYHGRILHGIQLVEPSRHREPTTYYIEGSGPALAIKHLRERRGKLRIGVLGLGTGSISCWANEGDTICFYEIDSNVVKLQRDYFTYLRECPAKVELVMGDARIKMESQEPQNFDILFMDAFSGDAVPMHLLTKEALHVYQKHLKPDGILAIHISNRFLKLDPVVLGLSLYGDMHIMRIFRSEDPNTPHQAASDWILMSKSDEIIKNEELVSRQSALEANRSILWTDQFSNLFDVLITPWTKNP